MSPLPSVNLPTNRVNKVQRDRVNTMNWALVGQALAILLTTHILAGKCTDHPTYQR